MSSFDQVKSDEFKVDCTVIGAGVVGCAVASELAKKGRSVVLLEAGPRIAEGTTSRNSGVIHAGIYYAPQSLKAKACVRGNKLQYEHAKRFGVSHRKVGKLIVATQESQLEGLEEIYKNALESGAIGLQRLNRSQARDLEPSLPVVEAILSSETGIIDPFELSQSLLQIAEENGAVLMTQAEVQAIHVQPNLPFVVQTTRGPVCSDTVVNCAGLYADEIAKLAGITKYRIHPCRGDYFTFQPAVKYQHLIYPVKEKNGAGLGVHLTLDLSGGCKLGPDVEYVSSKSNFSSAEHKLEQFRVAASRLFGEVSADQLRYDFCGIRPKLRSPEEKAEKDFVVSMDLPGFVNLVGIESPGLTASLALAEIVREML